MGECRRSDAGNDSRQSAQELARIFGSTNDITLRRDEISGTGGAYNYRESEKNRRGTLAGLYPDHSIYCGASLRRYQSRCRVAIPKAAKIWPQRWNDASGGRTIAQRNHDFRAGPRPFLSGSGHLHKVIGDYQYYRRRLGTVA